MSLPPKKNTEQSEESHSNQAYVSLAQLTDGGETYCTTLEIISRERRLDFEVADHAKEITREEQMQPKNMSDTRLKTELLKRDLYVKDQPSWALVIALEEAVRKESRILRLHQSVTQVLIKPNRTNRNKVKEVIGESKKQFRNKRINKRAAIHQTQEEAARRLIHQRHVYFSLPQLDAAFPSLDKKQVNDGIFIFNLKKEWIHKRKNKVPLKKDVLDVAYMTVIQPDLYEMLWRKEERGEVIWIKNKSYAALNRKFEKLTVVPREDDGLAKRVKPLQLDDFWWKRTWKKELPFHASRFTNSTQKILSSLETNCFELMSLAEIVYQSNPALFVVWGVPSLKEQKEMYHACKHRLAGDLGHGRYGLAPQDKDCATEKRNDGAVENPEEIDADAETDESLYHPDGTLKKTNKKIVVKPERVHWRDAEKRRREEEQAIKQEEDLFWGRVNVALGVVDEVGDDMHATVETKRTKTKNKPRKMTRKRVSKERRK